MKILVNGKPQEASGGITIKDILAKMGADTRYLAVAVNGDFVPRSEHGKTEIRDGDDIEVVSPQAGG